MISSLEKMTEEYDLDKDPNLRNALERLIDYFKKKSIAKRQKWVILYTDSFKNDGLIKDTIKKMEENEINLLVVALNMNKEESNRFADVIKTSNPKNKNEIIENENVTRLAQIFRINGIIQENEKKFINERYDCEKESNLRKNL
jgi:ABC-type branched-subunit amino acid transport system substrate-binding protein